MSFNDYSNVAVTTAATRLAQASKTRQAILIQNNHATAALYFGQNASITTATAGVIPAGQSVSDSGDGCHKGEWWGICSSGSIDVRVTDQYLVQVAGVPAR